MTPSAYPEDSLAPAVTLSAPLEGAVIDDGLVRVAGTVVDELGVADVTVAVGPNLPQSISDVDPRTGDFSVEVTLGLGDQDIVVTAWDLAGNVGEASVSVIRPVDLRLDLTSPILTLSAPEEGFKVSTPSVLLVGSASDDVGVASVVVTPQGGAPQLARTDDFFASWVYEAPLQSGVSNTIAVTATDLSGKSTTLLLRGETTAIADQQAPALTIDSPSDGYQTAEDTIRVAGHASDASGVASVEARVGSGPYQLATTADGYEHWEVVLPIVPGDNLIKVRARDITGLESSASLNVVNTSASEWGEATTVSLSWQEPEYALSTFELDREGLEALIPPSVAKEIVLLELELRPLMAAAAEQIRDACGAGWRTADLSAQCPANWTQAERNLYRLLTMTPANVNVIGTSIEGMAEIAATLSAIGLLDDFSDILAMALDIPVTGLIVDNDSVIASLTDNVIATHPNALPGGLVPVTMWDAMTDMVSFGPKFDAQGEHPGFVDTVFGETWAQVLGDNFAMTLVPRSNLHWHEGVALGESKAWIAHVADLTGPSFDDVLEFDFLDPERYSIEGLVAQPAVDLFFKAYEAPGWISIGDSRTPLPRGNSPVWGLAPHTLEYVFADAAFRGYSEHRRGCDLCSGAATGALLFEDPIFGIDEAEITIGRQGYDKQGDGEPEHFNIIAPNPAGWMRVWTLANLGDPPEAQYVWDMILEVCERRLLDGGVAQGEGHVRFPLYDVPVGMSGEEIAAEVRPVLEAQKSALSELLLGDYEQGADLIDFYLARGEAGGYWLFFVHPDDPVPPEASAHATPGFFADRELTEKLSVVDDGMSGDSVHEKLALGAQAQTVYCRDVSGSTYRIEVGAIEDASVTITTRRYLEGQP